MTLTRRGFLWAVAALLGIAVTVALTWSVGRLAGQRIGLPAEPLSVVQGLAPSHAAPTEPDPTTNSSQRADEHSGTRAPRSRSTPPVSLPATTPVAQASSSATSGPGAATAATAAATPSKAVAATASTSGSRTSNGGDPGDDSSGGGQSRARSGRDD